MPKYTFAISTDKIDIVIEYFYAFCFFPTISSSDGNISELITSWTDDAIIIGEYEKISYHMGDKYIVEARPRTLLEQQIEKTRKFKFTGEKISLNFQDIEIRAVLQLLADFTGMNIVANDSVQGNVTLRLDNIPWDQALDFILKSKGLA